RPWGRAAPRPAACEGRRGGTAARAATDGTRVRASPPPEATAEFAKPAEHVSQESQVALFRPFATVMQRLALHKRMCGCTVTQRSRRVLRLLVGSFLTSNTMRGSRFRLRPAA